MNKELFAKTITEELDCAQPVWEIGYESMRDFHEATNLISKVRLLGDGMATNDVALICGEPDDVSKWRGKSSHTQLRIKYVYYLRRKHLRVVNVHDQYLGFYFNESGLLESVVYPKETQVYTVEFKDKGRDEK